MRAAAEALDEFGVGYEVGVVSAHRTPVKMIEYARAAADRGLRVIIAGAGGAAHLPGMVASATPLPVIGVPVPLKHLDGMDSLLSIVQMPAGIPVATVSIGGARNAGLLAVRILAASDDGPAGTDAGVPGRAGGAGRARRTPRCAPPSTDRRWRRAPDVTACLRVSARAVGRALLGAAAALVARAEGQQQDADRDQHQPRPDVNQHVQRGDAR